MVPLATCWRRHQRGFRATRADNGPAKDATSRSETSTNATKTAPSTRKTGEVEPRSGCTNWGRKARKNIAVFGLNTSETKPCSTADPRCRGASCGCPPVPLRNSHNARAPK